MYVQIIGLSSGKQAVVVTKRGRTGEVPYCFLIFQEGQIRQVLVKGVLPESGELWYGTMSPAVIEFGLPRKMEEVTVISDVSEDNA